MAKLIEKATRDEISAFAQVVCRLAQKDQNRFWN